jgi:hypothetical protein
MLPYIVAIAFVLSMILLPRILFKQCSLGITALNNFDRTKALEHFQKFYDFTIRHSFMDRHRQWIPFLGTVWSYREIAMINLAATHKKMGNVNEAMKIYHDIISEFPENVIARDAIMDYEAIKQSVEAKRDGTSETSV